MKVADAISQLQTMDPDADLFILEFGDVMLPQQNAPPVLRTSGNLVLSLDDLRNEAYEFVYLEQSKVALISPTLTCDGREVMS